MRASVHHAGEVLSQKTFARVQDYFCVVFYGDRASEEHEGRAATGKENVKDIGDKHERIFIVRGRAA